MPDSALATLLAGRYRLLDKLGEGGMGAVPFQIPLSPRDHKLEEPGFLARNAGHPDFLRPPADFPLATGGAGKEDPSLPTYVGAVPPKGTRAWDWDRTWRMRMPKSKEVKSQP